MSEPKYITMHHRFYALFKCHEANQKSWSMTSSNRRWSITSIYGLATYAKEINMQDRSSECKRY
jgi:hypothetical protein